MAASGQIHYAIDVIDRTMICGWAIHTDGIKAIRVLSDGFEVGRGHVGLARPDIEAAFPHVKDSHRAGFRFRLGDLPVGHSLTLSVVIEAADGTEKTTTRLITRHKVSVITPNYNHAQYLRQRLDSILNQTFQDFELIVLDNASTDNSREVIESYKNDPRVRAIFNAENNGSTFKQWKLGLSHASGEYIWFAESDDYAEPTLLETLVERLDRHPNVGLAFCQSWAVDEGGNVLCNFADRFDNLYRHAYFPESECPSTRWRNDYVNSGPDETMNYLFWYNPIPNASAVLLRRGVLERAGGVPDDMLLNGDHMTYIKVLSISDIAFVATPLNFFRQHAQTVRNRITKLGLSTREIRLVHSELVKRYSLQRLLRADLGVHRIQGNEDEPLTAFVKRSIRLAKRPPDDIVPPRQVFELLFWFAGIHPATLRVALPMLTRQAIANLARGVGLLGLARKLRVAYRQRAFTRGKAPS